MTTLFFATTPKGMEELLEQELRDLGAEAVETTRAGVAFRGSLETAYRACLYSRVANRVLLPLKTFSAPTPEKLYGGVKSIRWSDHLTPQQTIAVDFAVSQSQITHTHFGALKTKDAICDQLRSNTGERPSVDPKRPDIRINVYVLKDEATVSLDLSGDSLHRRGYRPEGEGGGDASLKENLAAAMLMMAGWPEKLKKARESGTALPSLIDPMCGSGTILCEAAQIAAHRAPGLGRDGYYGFLGWQGHVPALWKRLVEEAKKLEITDRKWLPRIDGFDRDPRAVRVAIANLAAAGFAGKVHVEKRDISELAPLEGQAAGIVVVNPPYGERLGETEELVPVYKSMGDIFKKRFAGWEGYILTSNPDLANAVGLKASRRFVLFNGALECRLLKYEMYEGKKLKSV
jgi:23S rRNA (guanine2445-N2)-methyltransferase / 23S rRNA (guanine2069-N7)-methyltransferase